MNSPSSISHPKNSSDERYKSIIDNSVHAFFLATPDGIVLDINKAAENLFGYNREELLNLKRKDLVDESEPGFFMAMQKRHQEGFVTSEATAIKKNGERFIIEFSSAFFIDTDGILKVSTLVSDISEKKQARQALEESEMRYKLFLKQSTEGIWRVDLPEPMHVNTPLEQMISTCYDTAFIAECNDTFAMMYGFNNAAEMIGLPLKNLLPEHNPLNLHYLTNFFANGFKVTEQISFENDANGNQSIYVNNMVGIIVNDHIKSAWGIQRDITQQKKAETELLSVIERNNLISHATNDAIWDWDVVENRIWGNEVYKNLIGAVTYQEFNEKLHPEDRKRIDHNFVKARDGQNRVISEEFRCMTTDGTYRDFYDRAYMLYDASGRLYRMSGAMQDITERKKTVEALAESENRFRIMFNSDPECIKLMNQQCILLDMNPTGLGIIEAEDISDVKGKSLLSLLLPEYQPKFSKLLNDIFDGKSGKLQYEITSLKGTRRFMDTHAVPLRNTEGKVIACLGISRDISESKIAESMLHESEERYRYLFNNNPANIMIWDEETLQIMEANEATLQTYGYSKEEFLQLKKSDLIIKEDQSNSNVHRHVNSKGATLLMEMSYHKIDYKGRKAVLALGQDVTEKILLENSLAEERQIRQKQITDAVITGQEKERSQLGEELHDNINQILATTRLYIECAVSDEHPRPDLVKESKLLLERAMNEIRQLSKTLLPPSLGEIGLVEAISDLVENINETNALEIENKWRGFNEEALGEKLKLTIFRIVQEQMSNITKHSQAKKASISLKNEDDNVVLEVSDNGIGFNPSLKRTGLGLRNMTSRAEVNNGTLTINSQPGAGCVITVSFPTS